MNDAIVKHLSQLPPTPARRPGFTERRLLTGPDSPHQNVILVDAVEGAEVELHPVPNSESIFMVAGAAEVFDASTRQKLGPGDLAHFPPGASHGMKIVSGPARYLVIFAPARNAMATDGDMKADWNARAKENAEYYIATTQWKSEDEFDRSGARDAALFFESEGELLTPSTTVLDIGCGIGRMDRHVAPRVKKLIGIDVSGEMVRRARERLADLKNVEFVEGDGRSLAPIASGSIDLVFSHIVFQHMPKSVMREYCREVHRVLASGGHFLFQVPETHAAAPPDPVDADTFEMRYHREDELRSFLVSLGFTWEGCRRHRVAEATPPFDHIRPRVRK